MKEAIVVVANQFIADRLGRLFPEWVVVPYQAPLVGYRAREVIIAAPPKNQRDVDWIEGVLSMRLRGGNSFIYTY